MTLAEVGKERSQYFLFCVLAVKKQVSFKSLYLFKDVYDTN